VRIVAWKCAVATGGLLTAAYFAFPGMAYKDVMYSVIGLASLLCMVAGVRMHRPADPLPWWAMAGSNVCFVAGDGVLNLYDLVLHRDAPFPSVADALYLAGYPLLLLAVLRLSRSESRVGLREDRIDAAIVSIGALTLSWHVLMGSYAHDSTISSFGKLVTMGYPIMDIGVLFIVVSGLLSSTGRRPVDTLIGLAMASMMVADFGYDILVLHGAYQTGNLIDAGWLISYVLMGVAALHPSVAVDPGARPPRGETRRRLPLVALAGFIGPGILLIAGLVGSELDVPVLASLSIVLLALVVLRVTWLLSRLTNQTLQLRERTHRLQDALNRQQLLEDDLRYQSFHDGLTGLPNRALLHDRVEHALHAAARATGTVAVLFCDLDGFKTINDSLGHHAGDDLLIVVGKRLSSVVRAGDTVARLGGDDFAILMDDVSDPSVALAVAERALSVLRRPIELSSHSISVSISIGIAFGDTTKSSEQLLSEADAAMFEAKAAGKDRVQIFQDSMRTRIIQRLELRNSFATALEAGQFHLQYQPYESLQDGRVEGFEALVRWRHPLHGEIRPLDFISLAEETGFIIPLGRWVLETACNTAATWAAPHGRGLTVSVNVSGRQLQNDQLVDDVKTALSYSGIRPEQLMLEVTESMLMVKPEESAAILGRLKSLGVRLAIDDFGTGYSSLSHLRQFPVDVIKIDKSFVDPLADPANEGQAFVGSIIRLAHDLRLSTVAEGVESLVQRQALIDLGCDSAQGYLLSRPLDPHAAEEWIAQPVR
jgi:diguanylate cyclase (GGDEF)-like protein